MKRVHVDANIVLRFLRNDDPRQSSAAKRLIETSQAGQAVLILSPVTIAEVFYAFRASYKMTRPDVATVLGNLLRTSVFEVEHEARVLDAMDRVKRSNVDFGDAYLAATAAESKESVASFDEDFRKFSDVKWHVP
jgi:predicted nucleic acid-binding protein